MLDRPLQLPVAALARVIRAENLGELHITLAPTATWAPREAEQTADAQARAELARVGGVDRRGRIDIDMEATLRLLCAPRVEFYGWINEGDRTIGVLVAAVGRDAVLAIRDGDTVHLSQVQPERLPDALVAQTPEVQPGRGKAMTVSLSDLRPDSSGRLMSAAFRNSSPDLRMAQQVMETPTTGGGQLFTAVRDSSGRRHRVQYPLRYADTVTGRWLNVTVPGSEPRVIIAPADRRALAGRLHEMHMTLTRN